MRKLYVKRYRGERGNSVLESWMERGRERGGERERERERERAHWRWKCEMRLERQQGPG